MKKLFMLEFLWPLYMLIFGLSLKVPDGILGNFVLMCLGMPYHYKYYSDSSRIQGIKK